MLRDYQIEAIAKYHSLNSNKVLFVSPTGSGKTVIISELIKQLPGSVLFLTHRQEILLQAASYFGECNIIKAGYDKEVGTRITIAQVQTLTRRTLPPADVVISDEVHHCRSATWEELLKSYPNARHIGLTATPFRIDGKGLGSLFTDVIDVASIDYLIDNGYLVKPRYFGTTSEPNVSKVKKSGGDFNNGELSNICMERTIVAGVVDSIKKYMQQGKSVVVYAVGKEHACQICWEVPAALYLDGETKKEDRNSLLDRFSLGLSQCIVNVGVLTEGWDCPRADCIVLARPTCSTSLYLQMVGRGLRPFNNKKEAIIVDHGGNVKRHGFAEDKHEYTLEDGLIVSGKKDKDSLHTCKNCLAVFLGDRCPACNKMREKTTIEIHEEKKELVELKRVQMTSDERKKEYDKIVSWAKWKGYSPKVVFGRYVGTFHTSPDREWSKGVIGWKSGGPIWL